jgi:hypothetical protein
MMDILKAMPWWVWLIVVGGVALVIFLSLVMPTLLVTQTAPRGSRERAFVGRVFGVIIIIAVANMFLCLVDASRQALYSTSTLIAMLLIGPWAMQRQKTIRRSEVQTSNETSQQSSAGDVAKSAAPEK